MSELFLVDAMSFIHRAFHAMTGERAMYSRSKTTRELIPTSASYVFINMLTKLRNDFRPEYLAVAFDLHAPTFRHKLFPEYKATRPVPDPELLQQLPYIRRILEALRIPYYEAAGYEADDVIATLAAQWKAQWRSLPVYIVTGDKDLLQLVDDHVLVMNPMKGNKVYYPKAVEETVGVPPKQVVDVMALTGDACDNVPGACGIGPAGAVELIRRFGSVEEALLHATSVANKRQRESLIANRNMILLSKQLVTLRSDAPVVLSPAQALRHDPDPELCRELYSELGFNSLLVEEQEDATF